MRPKIIALFAGLLLVTAAAVARADGEERLIHPWGMSVTVGGGVNDFVGDDMRGMTMPGGAWDARFTFGTRQAVGFEVAYLGTAQNIDALGMEDNAILMSNGLETGVRLNLLDGAVKPYFFGGAAWKRYDLTNTATNTSSVSESDNVLEVPLGIGLSVRYGGLIFDVRGTFRAAADADLVNAGKAMGKSNLDNFNVGAHVGTEF